MNEIPDRHRTFSDDNEKRLYGKTASFWIQYVYLIHLNHDFTRSLRTGDLDLYISCLPKITNIFFCNKSFNYARQFVKYYDSLIKFPNTHLEVYSGFQNGWFGIKQTAKSFFSTPTDLSLEQTINADASSQRLGITSMTNSISAKQHRAESHFLRITIIPSLLDMLDLKENENVSKFSDMELW